MKKDQSRRVWTPEQKAEIVSKHLNDHISVIDGSAFKKEEDS